MKFFFFFEINILIISGHESSPNYRDVKVLFLKSENVNIRTHTLGTYLNKAIGFKGIKILKCVTNFVFDFYVILFEGHAEQKNH